MLVIDGLRRQGGAALLAVLFSLIALLTLTGTLFLSAFLDREATSNFSTADDALFTAEAGIQHVWSVLVPAPDFAAELSWPDGRPPFASPVGFPEPPRTYRVRVEAAAGGGLRVLSEGTSHRGARQRVEATFRRAPHFRPGAVLTIADTMADPSLAGELSMATLDRDGAAEAPSRVGAESRAAAEAWAREGGGDIAILGPSGLRAALEELRASPDLTFGEPRGSETWGTPGLPVVVDLVAGAEILGQISATGIVVADTPIVVRGHLDVEGLLLAPRGIEVAGALDVTGAVWVGERLRIESEGRASIRFASGALDRADGLRPSTLPRETRLGGWREVW